MDKKKLVLREIIAILVTTGIFLVLFSILGGWKLQKEEQYNIITAEAGERFALASLVIEGKIIFAVISAITFL